MLSRLMPFFTLAPIGSAARSAGIYVPMVIFTRALAFLRLLVVASLLGEAGKAQFGLYQPALELVNWLTPFVLLGLADVAERYAAAFEHRGQLAAFFRRQFRRLMLSAAGVAALLALAGPWLGPILFAPDGLNLSRDGSIALLLIAAATLMAVAVYHWLAGALRGLRAYAAVAGMETFSSLLMLGLSALAAAQGSALALLAAYALGTLIPVTLFGLILLAHLRRAAQHHPLPLDAVRDARLDRFGRWTLLRLLLMMTWLLVALWSVRWLAAAPGGAGFQTGTVTPESISRTTADYAMAYRVAQMLAYLAAALWSSSYAIAAGLWATGRHRRAQLALLRVGRTGGLLLLAVAIGAMLLRGTLLWIIPPSYAPAIDTLVPPLLGVFLWFSLAGFFVMLADLQERPWIGAAIWAGAVLVQAGLILAALFGPVPPLTPATAAVLANATAAAFAALLLAPLLLWRPRRLHRALLPLLPLLLSPLAFFLPAPLSLPAALLSLALALWAHRRA